MDSYPSPTSVVSCKPSEFEEAQERVKRFQKLVKTATFIVAASVVVLTTWYLIDQSQTSVTTTHANATTLHAAKDRKTWRTTPINNHESTGENNGHTRSENVCDTEDCHFMRRLIDLSVDKRLNPCDNFFTYVCNGAVRSIQDLANGFSIYVHENLHKSAEQWMINGIIGPGKQSGYQKVLAFYASCVDTRHVTSEKNYVDTFLRKRKLALIERLDFDPLKKQIEFMLIGLPVLFEYNMVSYSAADQAYISLLYKGRSAKTVAGEPRIVDERKSIVEKILKFVFSIDTIDEHTVNSILEAEDKISHLTEEEAESAFITFPMSQVGFTEGSDERMSSRWIQALEEHRPLLGDIDTITLQMRRSHVALLHSIFGSTPLINKHLLQTLFAWIITYDLYELSGFLDSARQPQTVRVWCYESAKRTFPSVATLKVLHEIVNQ
ncbi:uncharacterized protein LOC135384182 [Ornithodoros turicata]|uniref:uncharacterized protein LOC135384182 n=1 Tax=Ornithodoros turicata TaxID=34597 RepID=UPI003138CE0D